MQWENEIFTPYKPEPHFDYKKDIEEALSIRKETKLYKLFQSYLFSIYFFIIIFDSLFTLFWLLTTDSGYDEYGQWKRGDVSVIVLSYIGITFAAIFAGWAITWTFKYHSKSRAINNIDKLELFKKYTSNVEGFSLNNANWGAYSQTAGSFIEPQLKAGKYRLSAEESFLMSGSFKNVSFEFTTAKWWINDFFNSLQEIGMSADSFGFYNHPNNLGPTECFVSQIVIKDEIFNSFNETNISPAAIFSNQTFMNMNDSWSNRVKFANDNFNTLFVISGDDVNLHKLFNATEQENYIKLYKKFPHASVQINDGAMYITFPTPEAFRKK